MRHSASMSLTAYYQHLISLSTDHATLVGQGWGLLKQYHPVHYFPKFSALSKHKLCIEYQVDIWQVSPQLSCGDTCPIWTWKNLKGTFARSKILIREKLKNGTHRNHTESLQSNNDYFHTHLCTVYNCATFLSEFCSVLLPGHTCAQTFWVLTHGWINMDEWMNEWWFVFFLCVLGLLEFWKYFGWVLSFATSNAHI